MRLHHAIKITAPRSEVFAALTELRHMTSWHVGQVTGAVALGQILVLKPAPGLQFAWRTDTLEQDRLLVQTCLDGPGSSTGKILSFALSVAKDGTTLVDLTDGEWNPADPHLPQCNTHWGQVLHQLKTYCESTTSSHGGAA
jgi:uncharacterized protein YndB with AHSA1/START domain